MGLTGNRKKITVKPKPLRRRSRKLLAELKPMLDRISEHVETPDYIRNDPVQFMHAYEAKKDREIAGFLAALMAWGRRDIVVRKTENLLGRMNYRPFEYVMDYSPQKASDFSTFKHRTFRQTDLHGLISALQYIYWNFEDFEDFWRHCRIQAVNENRNMLGVFHQRFLSLTCEMAGRTRKHISNPEKNSPCKRITMFLRWVSRRNSSVDTGIWSFLSPSELMIPLDVHVARQSRRLGLLTRRSNDWKAVEELTNTLRLMNPGDPSRYDFALFGLGALGYALPKRFNLNPV